MAAAAALILAGVTCGVLPLSGVLCANGFADEDMDPPEAASREMASREMASHMETSAPLATSAPVVITELKADRREKC